ncbi:uncharacterized protein LOC124195032 [Daphnia pulex]|uniref:uncharacterized protein LOC124195032 n=1 Tax=Daphnia pulex TaxID=6669 RepID=UPI001EE07820|nr:uncharacterized protein LOC124195032 [Daphnia pulex]
MEYKCYVPSSPSQATRFFRLRFRITAVIGLLIGIITVFWQIQSHVDRDQPDVDMTFELEICFGIYGFFLASTSYYLGEIQASSWARFHIVISSTGIVLDLVLLVYHATSTILRGSYINPGNNFFMISIATLQAVNNSVAIFLCRKLIVHEHRTQELRFKRETSPEPNDDVEHSILLLKKPENVE